MFTTATLENVLDVIKVKPLDAAAGVAQAKPVAVELSATKQ
jgi:hypothetical protein